MNSMLILVFPILALLAGVDVAGRSPARQEMPPKPEHGSGQLSEFRSDFRTAGIKSCSQSLEEGGTPASETAIACPCMIDRILETTPEDDDLLELAPSVLNEAVFHCLTVVEQRRDKPQA